MIVNLPETAVKALKDAVSGNPDSPQNIRIHFAGIGWGGPSFGIALDEQTANDVECTVEDLHFIMDKNDYERFGDITIKDTGFGFKIVPSNIDDSDEGGCGGGCSGCGH